MILRFCYYLSERKRHIREMPIRHAATSIANVYIESREDYLLLKYLRCVQTIRTPSFQHCRYLFTREIYLLWTNKRRIKHSAIPIDVSMAAARREKVEDSCAIDDALRALFDSIDRYVYRPIYRSRSNDLSKEFAGLNVYAVKKEEECDG